MSGRIGPRPYRKLEKVLRQHGSQAVRQKGSHAFFEHADGRSTVVPKHPGKDIPPGLVRKILADARLSSDDLE